MLKADMKICIKCKIEKDENDFYFRDKNKGIRRRECKLCTNEHTKKYYEQNTKNILNHNKQYRIEHKEELKEYFKQYRIENKEKIKENKKQYNAEHKEEIKEYYIENKDKIKEYYKQYNIENKENIKENKKEYQKNRKKIDPAFKLRNNISSSINKSLRRTGSSKNGSSILKHLPYTIEELKNYIELLFEPWMNWENHGKYNNKTWKDNDKSTWTWHLDHITPQAHLPYTNMEDNNFKICWALENVRPYNAKRNTEERDCRSQEEIIKIKNDIKERLEKLGYQNILDGASKTKPI